MYNKGSFRDETSLRRGGGKLMEAVRAKKVQKTDEVIF